MISNERLLRRYEDGENVSRILRRDRGEWNESMVELTYEVQTGQYTQNMLDPEKRQKRREFTQEIAKEIKRVYTPESILEPGVGEATTLSGVLSYFEGIQSFAFDLSWSRIAYARRWLASEGMALGPTLFTASMFQIPLPENSIDVVYTAHAIEPNHGREIPLLEELYRVTKRYLILLEPAYDLANGTIRARMRHHNYCQQIKASIDDLGYTVLKHEIFSSIENELNPPAITIIEKKPEFESVPQLVCPKHTTQLQKIGDFMYSQKALTVYPILDGIPCLRTDNGILASKFPEIMRED